MSYYTKVPPCTYGCASILMGLNDKSFFTIRSQILALDLLPSLDKIFNVVQQEENHKKVMGARDQRYETTATFAVMHPMRANREQKQRERPVCGHCGKTGHDESTHYELIGYPPGWNTRGGRGSRGRGRAGRLSLIHI